MKLREIGEFGFIERIAPAGINRPEGVVKGIGDDCAVIDVGIDDYLLVTTDLLVERVHFLMDWYRSGCTGREGLGRQSIGYSRVWGDAARRLREPGDPGRDGN